MSVENSVINGQSDYVIEQLLPPDGINLSNSVTRSLPPKTGAIAYDISSTALYLGTSNTTWTRLSSGTSDVSLGPFGTVPNANGLSLTGQVLNMQPADVTFPGGVSTTTQAFTGVKDFSASGINLQTITTSLVTGLLHNYCSYNGVLTWSGAFAGTFDAPYQIERIGHIVIFKTDLVFKATPMAATLITSVGVPVEFRPSVNISSVIGVISASATNSGGWVSGAIVLNSAGLLEVGIGMDEASAVIPFGAASIGATSNGIANKQTAVFLV